jgi:hypothetical protein
LALGDSLRWYKLWRLLPQDDIREVVAYAAERYVNVVPEIEMPGTRLLHLRLILNSRAQGTIKG